MNENTLNALLAYVIFLVREEGCDAVHVTNLIPPYRLGMQRKWTQFPHLSEDQTKRLDAFGVSYHQPSGWFRLKSIANQ